MGRPKKPAKKEEKQAVQEHEVKSILTYLGPGPLSGEYRFKELAGSVGAASVEDAIEKANEIAIKHPDLLITN